MKTICVYCGSAPGARSDYRDAAEDLARELLKRDLALVYGGASKGTMGMLADAMLAGGGRVTGVIPRALQRKEIAHRGLDDLHVVESMHERKALMLELSDAFIALPGGFGTLEEIIETLTWAQLGFHNHPCGLLNVRGYFDALLEFFRHAAEEGFLREQHRTMLMVEDEASALLAQFDRYEAPLIAKWRD
jgi:uncharacterized protein (TIGR00730 family)